MRTGYAHPVVGHVIIGRPVLLSRVTEIRTYHVIKMAGYTLKIGQRPRREECRFSQAVQPLVRCASLK
jgi:hypothetical protein